MCVCVYIWVFAANVANVMNSAWQVSAFFVCSATKLTQHNPKFTEGQRGKRMTIFFQCMPFYFIFPCAHRHTHKCARALLEVEAKRLTLNVGLLISRISGRSKRTIKGGAVFGSEGSLASQHMDMAMKKKAAEGVSLRSTAELTLGHMQADWPSGEKATSSNTRHTNTHTLAQGGMDALTPMVMGSDVGKKKKKHSPKRTRIYTHSDILDRS